LPNSVSNAVPHGSCATAHTGGDFFAEGLVVVAADHSGRGVSDNAWSAEVIGSCVARAVRVHCGGLNGGQQPAGAVDVFFLQRAARSFWVNCCRTPSLALEPCPVVLLPIPVLRHRTEDNRRATSCTSVRLACVLQRSARAQFRQISCHDEIELWKILRVLVFAPLGDV